MGQHWRERQLPSETDYPGTVIAFALCFIVLLLTLIFLWIVGALRLVTPAKAHGSAHWIEEQRLVDPMTKVLCCGTADCMEEVGNVQAGPEGFYTIISTGEHIDARRVIWRSPGGWWRCRNLSTNETRCLLGPPGSS